MSLPPFIDRFRPHRGWARAAVLAFGLGASLPSAAAWAEAFGDWRLDCAASETCRLSVEGREEVTGEPRFTLALAASGQTLALEFATRGPRPDDGRAMQWEVDGQVLHVLRPGEFALHGDVRRFFVTDGAAGRKLLAAMRKGTRLRISYLDAVAEAHDAVFSLDGLTAGLEVLVGRAGLAASPPIAAPALAEVAAPSRGTAVAALGIPYAVLERHARTSDCEGTDSSAFRNVDIPIAALGQTAVLYALPCTVSGRTVTYRLYLRDTGEIGGLETLFFALHDPRFGWIGTDLLANVSFDDVSRTLRAEYTGPSDRTCGYRAAWSWRDHAFRLESFEGPSDCRDADTPGRWQRHHPR